VGCEINAAARSGVGAVKDSYLGPADLSRDFKMDPLGPSVVALNGRITPSLNSFILSGTLTEVILTTPVPSAAPRS
jgi:hypothetical protein